MRLMLAFVLAGWVGILGCLEEEPEVEPGEVAVAMVTEDGGTAPLLVDLVSSISVDPAEYLTSLEAAAQVAERLTLWWPCGAVWQPDPISVRLELGTGCTVDGVDWGGAVRIDVERSVGNVVYTLDLEQWRRGERIIDGKAKVAWLPGDSAAVAGQWWMQTPSGWRWSGSRRRFEQRPLEVETDWEGIYQWTETSIIVDATHRWIRPDGREVKLLTELLVVPRNGGHPVGGQVSFLGAVRTFDIEFDGDVALVTSDSGGRAIDLSPLAPATTIP